MNQYDQYEYEEEIDLKALLLYFLKRWKVILLGAAFFAVLLGGLKGVQGYKRLQDKEAIAKSQAEYKEAKAAYNYARDQYLKRVDRMKVEIADQEAYRKNSILMTIDPYAVYTATVAYYVSTDYEIMPGMEFQNPNYTTHVLNAYRQIILSSDLLKDLDGAGNWDEADARQMVSVTVDGNNGLLNVVAKWDSEEQAYELLKSIETTIDSSKDMVDSLVYKHDIRMLKEDQIVAVDNEILKKQIEFQDNLVKMEKAVSDALIDRDKLKEPANTVFTKKQLIKNLIKYLFFGALAGMFLVCLIYGLIYFLKGALKTSDYLCSKHNALILGEIDLRRKEKGRSYALAAAGIRNLLGKGESLLLTGNLPEPSLKQLQAGLQPYLEGISVVSEAELMNNPNAMKALGEADAVVFAEQTDVSKVKEIDAAFKICDAMHVNMLGCIVLK